MSFTSINHSISCHPLHSKMQAYCVGVTVNTRNSCAQEVEAWPSKITGQRGLISELVKKERERVGEWRIVMLILLGLHSFLGPVDLCSGIITLTLENERTWIWFQIQTHNTGHHVTLRNPQSPFSVSVCSSDHSHLTFGVEINVIKSGKSM